MKSLIYLALFTFSVSAFAAKLEKIDLEGDIFIFDQSNGLTQGVVTLENSGNLTFTGIIAGKPYECEGTAEFDMSGQFLISHPTCNKTELSALSLSLKKSDISNYLRNHDVIMTFNFAQRDSAMHGFKSLYSHDLQGRKVRKK